MRFQFFFLLTLLIPALAVAQYDSRLQRFKVDEKKGCAPFTVTLISTGNALLVPPVNPCSGTDPCTMEWGDNKPNEPNKFTHTYDQPGTYLLKVLYQTIGYDDITITVTPNTQPTFEVYTCGGREVQVKVTDINYDSYIINYGDGSPEVNVPKGDLAVDNYVYATAGAKTISVRGKNMNADDNCTPPATKAVTVVNSLMAPFIDVLTVTNSTQVELEFNNALYSDNVLYKLQIAQNTASAASFQPTSSTFLNVSSGSIGSLRTDDNYYCFRLGAFDPCLNSSLQSNIICSANFDMAPQNNVNNLAWATSTTGVANFTVNRDGALLGTTGALTYADNTVVCNTDYCYQIETNYSNGSQSISLEKCGTAFSTDIPTASENVTAVVGTGTVDLTWIQDPAFQTSEYKVFRKSGGGGFNLLTTTTTTQVTDPDYDTEASSCYRIHYKDACDNNSADGIEVCPIRLSGNVKSDNSIELNWSDYTGWKNGVDHYIIEKYDEQGALLETINNITATTYTDLTVDTGNQIYSFIVKAVANDAGLGEAVSNQITEIKEPNIFYPKAFTPNDDNLNDAFIVFGQYVEKFEMKIFNRWGELLFTTDNLLEGWDGRYKGSVQPEGTYAFTARMTDLSGRTFNRSGTFVLMKKR